VAADVDKCAQGAFAVAHGDNRNVAGPAGEEGLGLRDVLRRAGVLPRALEDPLLLAAQDLCICVPAPWQRFHDGNVDRGSI
jgi:hypothetical protein